MAEIINANISLDRSSLAKVFQQQGISLSGVGTDVAKEMLKASEAVGEFESTEQIKRSKQEGGPRLKEPEANRNYMASFMEAASKIRSILSDGYINELRNQLHELKITSEAVNQHGESLINKFEEETNNIKQKEKQFTSAREEWKHCKTDRKNATNHKVELDKKLTANQQSQITLNNQLASTQKQLDALIRPLTEKDNQKFNKLTQKIDQLKTESVNLQKQEQRLEVQLTQATTQLGALELKESAAESHYINIGKEISELTKIANVSRESLNVFFEQNQHVDIDGNKWENTLALLTMLTASLKKAMNEDSLNSMKEQEEVMAKISEASRKDSDKKAKEAEEAKRKADEANKAASCASKIFSYIMLAVSVIATVATFGAAAPLTLAVAAIGIAMAVTDIVLEETGNGSIMQHLATAIGSVVTDMLVAFGMSQEEAKKIGSIVGMIVAAVAMLALSLASMGSFVKNIANTIKNVAKMAVNVTKTVVKSTVKAIANAIVNVLKNLLSKIKTLGKAADDAILLTKFTKLADAAEELQSAAKTIKTVKSVNQAAKKADDLKGVVKSADKLTDQSDSIKDVVKATEQVVEQVDDAANAIKASEKLGKQSLLAARVEVGAKGFGVITSVTNAATVGGLRLYGAEQLKELKELLAKMMMNDEIIKALDELLESLIKMLSKQYEVFNDMFTGMLSSLKQSNEQKVNSINLSNYA
ncbi:type III secretion system translocon subunit SctE [Providencia manganoxydans]|uniref:type III secretion system translocon subunit SctE n=1 Tax=Providencia manganoxydans TaxID=2923283 RepID=UPI0032DA53F3